MFPLENQVANFLQTWLGDSMLIEYTNESGIGFRFHRPSEKTRHIRNLK